MEAATIQDLILSACGRPLLADKTALTVAAAGETGEKLTYAGLARAIGKVALALREAGLSEGGRVALMSESRPLWGAAYLGVLAEGGVCVPIDPAAHMAEVKEILHHSGARIVLCSGRTEPTARDALDELKRTIPLIRMGALGTGLDDARDAGLPKPQDPGREAVIIYTSGTTGRPKAVRLSHRNIVSNVRSMTEAIEVGEGDSFLSVLPLNHTFECTAGLLLPLSTGASVSYARSFRPRDLREALLTTRPTVMLGVPLLYEKILSGMHRAIRRAPVPQRVAGTLLLVVSDVARRAAGPKAARAVAGPLREKAGLDRVRYLISGAAALSPSVHRGFECLGVTMLQGYGLTEASPVVAVNPPHGPRAGTVGLPLPGVEIQIESPDQDGVGEILVRGQNVMLGYFGDDEATAEVMSDGWLKTGDLGLVGPDGHLRLAGRRKSVIVTSAGKNVYPEEVEETLLSSRFILEAVVVGRSPGQGRGEQPWAIIFPDREQIGTYLSSDPMELGPEQVQSVIKGEVKRLAEGMADHKRVRGFTLRDEEFPKTSTNKIKRYEFIERNQSV